MSWASSLRLPPPPPPCLQAVGAPLPASRRRLLSRGCFIALTTHAAAGHGRAGRQALRVAATAAPPAHVAEEQVLSTSRFDDAGLTMHVVRLG